MLISVACHQFPPFFLVSMVLWNYKSLFPTVLFRSALSSWGRLHIGSRRGGRVAFWNRSGSYEGGGCEIEAMEVGSSRPQAERGAFSLGTAWPCVPRPPPEVRPAARLWRLAKTRKKGKTWDEREKENEKEKRSDHPPQICLTSYCHEGGSGPSFYFLILSVSTWDKSLLCDDTMFPYNHIHLIGVIIQKNKNKTTGED